jgi:hypothetical protein
MVPDSSVPDAPPVGRFWRLINADGTAVSVLLQGELPQKLSHFALHIQICTMPTEPRGMVQDSPYQTHL